MNSDAKISEVIRLYKHKKTQLEISGICHMSLRDVNLITKTCALISQTSNNADGNDDNITNLSPKQVARAFLIFEGGGDAVKAVIKLRIDNLEAKSKYESYLEMKNLGNLVTLLKEEGNEGVDQLVAIQSELKKHRMPPNYCLDKLVQLQNLEEKIATKKRELQEALRKETELLDVEDRWGKAREDLKETNQMMSNATKMALREQGKVFLESEKLKVLTEKVKLVEDGIYEIRGHYKIGKNFERSIFIWHIDNLEELIKVLVVDIITSLRRFPDQDRITRILSIGSDQFSDDDMDFITRMAEFALGAYIAHEKYEIIKIVRQERELLEKDREGIESTVQQ
ncbi:MAG: hypothetical protein ACREAY_04270 [Nitrososphaera sp.]|uniref:hypothetical protein n=1 Tax=Nitrososphaera sp. TaxID=1971748 RepID=UPI003D6FAE02